MTETGPRDDAKLAPIKLEWWPRSDWNRWPPSLESAMYRILHANSEVCARRKQLRHPVYTKPELLAVAPNEVWSWDITKLKGPAKWTYFYLYVILDIFSRRVVGWCVADAESAACSRLCSTTPSPSIQ